MGRGKGGDDWIHRFSLGNQENGPNPVFFRRRVVSKTATQEASEAYRSCLLQLGNDASDCEAVLETGVPTLAEREDVRTRVLGHVRDQKPAGMCGNDSMQTETDRLLAGGRIRSTTCQSFCSSDKARTNGYCGNQLKDYCAYQTKAKSQEHSCNCWLTYDTYKSALDEAQKELKVTAEEEAKMDPGPPEEGGVRAPQNCSATDSGRRSTAGSKPAPMRRAAWDLQATPVPPWILTYASRASRRPSGRL